MNIADTDNDRYFFALWPEKPVCRQLEHAARNWLDAGDGRVTKASRYHLTLLYLGTLGETNARCLQEILADLQGRPLQAFELTLDRTGTFGSSVAWIGCGTIPPGLRELHESLVLSAAAAGIVTSDVREFVPHVTISRRTGRRWPTPAPLFPPICWPVHEYRLVRSLPAEHFAYRTVARLPLAAETHG